MWFQEHREFFDADMVDSSDVLLQGAIVRALATDMASMLMEHKDDMPAEHWDEFTSAIERSMTAFDRAEEGYRRSQ